jgi:drug/metabolite transporter (DMT)-like permease
MARAVGGARFGWGIALALARWRAGRSTACSIPKWLQRHTGLNATDWANWLGMATGLGALLLWLVAGSDVATLQSRPDGMLFVWIALAGGVGSSWLATILWNVASQRLSASLCGQLIVSETLFALLYSFAWDGRWPQATEWVAALLFVLGILASIKAHR